MLVDDGRGILQSRTHDCLIGNHECLLLFTPSCLLGAVAMSGAVLFILRSRFLLYSAGSRVNRGQAVLSGFSVGLFYFVQVESLCRYVLCISWLHLCFLCVDVMVITSA